MYGSVLSKPQASKIHENYLSDFYSGLNSYLIIDLGRNFKYKIKMKSRNPRFKKLSDTKQKNYVI